MFSIDSIIEMLPRGLRSSLIELEENRFKELVSSFDEVFPTAAKLGEDVIRRTLPTMKILKTLKELFSKESVAMIFYEGYGTGKTTTMNFVIELIKGVKEGKKTFESRLEYRLQKLKYSKVEVYRKELEEIRELYEEKKHELIGYRLVYIGLDDVTEREPLHSLVYEKLFGSSEPIGPKKAAEEIIKNVSGLVLLVDEYDKRIIEHGYDVVDKDANFFRYLLEASRKNKRKVFIVFSANRPLGESTKEKLDAVISEISNIMSREYIAKEAKTRLLEFIYLAIASSDIYDLRNIEVDEAGIIDLEEILFPARKPYGMDEISIREAIRNVLVRVAAYLKEELEYPLSPGLFPASLLERSKNRLGNILSGVFRTLNLFTNREKIREPEKAKIILKGLAISIQVPEDVACFWVGEECSSILKRLEDQKIIELDGNLVRLSNLYKLIPEELYRVKVDIGSYSRDPDRAVRSLLSLLSRSCPGIIPSKYTKEALEEYLLNIINKERILGEVNTKYARDVVEIVKEEPKSRLQVKLEVDVRGFLKDVYSAIEEYIRGLVSKSSKEVSLDDAIKEGCKRRMDILTSKYRDPEEYLYIRTKSGTISYEDFVKEYGGCLSAIEYRIETLLKNEASEEIDITEYIEASKGICDIDEESLRTIVENILTNILNKLRREGRVKNYTIIGNKIEISYVDPKEKEAETIERELEKTIKSIKRRKEGVIKLRRPRYLEKEEYYKLIDKHLASLDGFYVLSNEKILPIERRREAIEEDSIRIISREKALDRLAREAEREIKAMKFDTIKTEHLVESVLEGIESIPRELLDELKKRIVGIAKRRFYVIKSGGIEYLSREPKKRTRKRRLKIIVDGEVLLEKELEEEELGRVLEKVKRELESLR